MTRKATIGGVVVATHLRTKHCPVTTGAVRCYCLLAIPEPSMACRGGSCSSLLGSTEESPAIAGLFLWLN